MLFKGLIKNVAPLALAISAERAELINGVLDTLQVASTKDRTPCRGGHRALCVQVCLYVCFSFPIML